MDTAEIAKASGPAPEWLLNLIPAIDRDNVEQETTRTISTPVKIWMAAKLGQGSIGQVVAGIWHEQKVAVKVIGTLSTAREKEELAVQVARWQNLHHFNILPFLAQCNLGFGQVALLSPYMENGNLMEFIKKYPSEDRLTLLRQAAEGVRYLHTCADLVHGDLKCANILVSAHRTALIGDFGLSTVLTKLESDYPTKTYIRHRHTVPFAAPELFDDSAMQPAADTDNLIQRSKTKYSDVYAFGMLIYEAKTSTAPWDGVSLNVIPGKVLGGQRPGNNGAFSDDLWKLCESCWKQDPFARIDITEILAEMTRLVPAN